MKKHTRSLIKLIRERVGTSEMTGCEVGVWRGGNSEGLLRELLGLRLVMVDKYVELTPEEAKSDRDLSKKNLGEMVEAMMEARQRTVDVFGSERAILVVGESVAVSESIADASFDFVFIDANHTYESVSRDLAAWWPKLKTEGLFVGHDYKSSGRKAGVKKAVDEFAEMQDARVQTAPGLLWWFTKGFEK